MTSEELLTIIAQARTDEVTTLNLSQQGWVAILNEADATKETDEWV
jgi:hypothetical protein